MNAELLLAIRRADAAAKAAAVARRSASFGGPLSKNEGEAVLFGGALLVLFVIPAGLGAWAGYAALPSMKAIGAVIGGALGIACGPYAIDGALKMVHGKAAP